MDPRKRRAVDGVAALVAVAVLAGCASRGRGLGEALLHTPAYNRPYTVRGRTYTPTAAQAYDEVGVASWYGRESGGHTSNGERLTMTALTAAHRTLPIPSVLEVTNLENGRRLHVRLNDRGPFHDSRLLDLSREAARRLGFLDRGSARVRVRYLGPASSTLAANDDEPGLTLAATPVGADLRAPQDLQAWSVRLGAFDDVAQASHAAAALATTGQARVTPFDEVGRTWYRVVVLPGDGRSAEETRRRIIALGYAGARVSSVD